MFAVTAKTFYATLTAIDTVAAGPSLDFAPLACAFVLFAALGTWFAPDGRRVAELNDDVVYMREDA